MAATKNTPKTCSRPGCDKQLRPQNTTGMCSTNCRSPEAPTSARRGAAGGDDDVLKRFRRVAKALGKDPDAILSDAMKRVAGQWLETLEAAVQ